MLAEITGLEKQAGAGRAELWRIQTDTKEKDTRIARLTREVADLQREVQTSKSFVSPRRGSLRLLQQLGLKSPDSLTATATAVDTTQQFRSHRLSVNGKNTPEWLVTPTQVYASDVVIQLPASHEEVNVAHNVAAADPKESNESPMMYAESPSADNKKKPLAGALAATDHCLRTSPLHSLSSSHAAAETTTATTAATTATTATASSIDEGNGAEKREACRQTEVAFTAAATDLPDSTCPLDAADIFQCKFFRSLPFFQRLYHCPPS